MDTNLKKDRKPVKKSLLKPESDYEKQEREAKIELIDRVGLILDFLKEKRYSIDLSTVINFTLLRDLMKGKEGTLASGYMDIKDLYSSENSKEDKGYSFHLGLLYNRDDCFNHLHRNNCLWAWTTRPTQKMGWEVRVERIDPKAPFSNPFNLYFRQVVQESEHSKIDTIIKFDDIRGLDVSIDTFKKTGNKEINNYIQRNILSLSDSYKEDYHKSTSISIYNPGNTRKTSSIEEISVKRPKNNDYLLIGKHGAGGEYTVCKSRDRKVIDFNGLIIPTGLPITKKEYDKCIAHRIGVERLYNEAETRTNNLEQQNAK